MGKYATVWDRRDLERVEAELLKIQNACIKLLAFSREKGGIPFIERNLAHIGAPLKLLMCLSEVLDIERGQ
jgi:hypothetical protein